MATQYLPYQQRVVDEATELKIKLTKLLGFIETFDSPDCKVDEYDKLLLDAQATHMVRYLNVLDTRILNFGVQNARL